MIRFIPNDPLAVNEVPARRMAARPDRAGNRAGFSIVGDAPEQVYPVGDVEFVQWQARQAAMLALDAWEDVSGKPFTAWAQEAESPLSLIPDLGEELNAYYDRRSVSFCHQTHGAEIVYFGSSTDVVAHEVGHAVLDALRPDFWESKHMEVNAFHEGFGDITAIITALSDSRTRKKLLEIAPDLSAPNFVEAIAEDISEAIRRTLGADHSASQPRHALNTFTWQLPDSMPDDGGPNIMINEVHSIARIISGCFYDLVALIFRSGQPTVAKLLAANRVAGRLLFRAVKSTPDVPRFFRALGRTMVLDDETLYGGVHGAFIVQAFRNHGLALGAESLLSPELSLASESAMIDRRAGAVTLAAGTLRNLRQAIGAPSRGAVDVRLIELGDTPVASVAMREDIPLDSVDARLKNCVAPTNHVALIGESGGRAALLFAPRAQAAASEVLDFVHSLVHHDQVVFDTPRRAGAVATHGIRTRRGGQKELYRIQFSCGPWPRP